jgi:hypothetical protein
MWAGLIPYLPSIKAWCNGSEAPVPTSSLSDGRVRAQSVLILAVGFFLELGLGGCFDGMLLQVAHEQRRR